MPRRRALARCTACTERSEVFIVLNAIQQFSKFS